MQTESFITDVMPAGNGPFRPNPTLPPPPPPIDDPNYIPGPEQMPGGDYFSIGRAGQMQEAASNFGIGQAFGAGRGPMGGAMGGMAQLLAMRAKLAGRGRYDAPENGPGSGQQGGLEALMGQLNGVMGAGMGLRMDAATGSNTGGAGNAAPGMAQPQRPAWGQSAPAMRSGMFGMGGPAGFGGGMAGALAALKNKQGQGETPQGMGAGQAGDLMNRFRPLAAMGGFR